MVTQQYTTMNIYISPGVAAGGAVAHLKLYSVA